MSNGIYALWSGKKEKYAKLMDTENGIYPMPCDLDDATKYNSITASNAALEAIHQDLKSDFIAVTIKVENEITERQKNLVEEIIKINTEANRAEFEKEMTIKNESTPPYDCFEKEEYEDGITFRHENIRHIYYGFLMGQVIQKTKPLEFKFRHQDTGEERTVCVTKAKLNDHLDDECVFIYDELYADICDCEPVGETNVVECNCDEYASKFKFVPSERKI